MLKFYTNQEQKDEFLEKADEILPGVSKLAKGHKVLFAKGDKKEIYLISNRMYGYFKKTRDNKLPYSMGFYFGQQKSGSIVFSFNTAQEYVKQRKDKIVVLHPRAEQKFLFGRNLSVKKVIRYDDKIRKGDLVIVTNKRNEALGFGIAEIDFSEFEHFEKNKRVVNTKEDIGWYLRHD